MGACRGSQSPAAHAVYKETLSPLTPDLLPSVGNQTPSSGPVPGAFGVPPQAKAPAAGLVQLARAGLAQNAGNRVMSLVKMSRSHSARMSHMVKVVGAEL
ncbi:hypothetical protein SKAU_G00325620 [Synaphobranchus kaupii]|uniref:Uncharacterized protein n=1 Tax=Synaphobranchus kaupii TaxID=118154 RepID=A0A9Q1EPN7_SYNKA|nr:hypothetical protein SKAU_G00325620 [Synaphobranchus kaupii]